VKKFTVRICAYYHAYIQVVPEKKTNLSVDSLMKFGVLQGIVSEIKQSLKN